MKKNSIITLLLCVMGFGITSTSCSDMLDSTSDRYVYEAANDTLYNYWGILSSLQKLGERYVILGECRGDMFGEGPHLTDSIRGIMQFGLGDYQGTDKDKENVFLNVSDYYAVINDCNCYLEKADTTRVTDAQRSYFLREYAQVETIRAWTYLQLVIHYGEVPFFTQGLDTQDKFENLTKDRINADNIAEKLAPSLLHAYSVQINTLNDGGFPQYGTYGSAGTINSQKTMFHSELVLGDIYLLNNQYENAAQQYYNYLTDINYGCVLPTNYTCTAYKPLDSSSFTCFQSEGCPWTETGAWASGEESITCIFSVKNKEYGHVSSGLNEVLGFYPVQTTEKDEPFLLDPQVKHLQIIPSNGYLNLAGSQVYEVYDMNNYSTEEQETPAVWKPSQYVGVGDAREAWTNELKWKEDLNFGTNRWIFKQNPDSKGHSSRSGLNQTTYRLSMVYPMVYRKSQVWLRFAEALNRAGYPGYAFAILKNGLCYDRDMNYWVPRYKPASGKSWVDFNAAQYQVYLSDSQGNVYPSKDKLEKYLLENMTGTSDSTSVLEEFQKTEAYNSIRDDVTSEGIDPDTLSLQILGIGTCAYPDQTDNATVICNYIGLREADKANSVSFLNFDNSMLLGTSSLTIDKTQNRGNGTPTTQTTYEYSGGEGTYGIHSRGCGRLKYDERHSTYNYFDQINKMRVEEEGLTPFSRFADLYKTDNLSAVQDAVEDLIVDEEALELAFEGHRFFDLLRVARHRGGTAGLNLLKYHIGVRDGYWPNGTTESMELANKLTWKNIYLPLPDNFNETGKIYK